MISGPDGKMTRSLNRTFDYGNFSANSPRKLKAEFGEGNGNWYDAGNFNLLRPNTLSFMNASCNGIYQLFTYPNQSEGASLPFSCGLNRPQHRWTHGGNIGGSNSNGVEFPHNEADSVRIKWNTDYERRRYSNYPDRCCGIYEADATPSYRNQVCGSYANKNGNNCVNRWWNYCQNNNWNSNCLQWISSNNREKEAASKLSYWCNNSSNKNKDICKAAEEAKKAAEKAADRKKKIFIGLLIFIILIILFNIYN